MRPVEVSNEQIIEAGQALKAAGRNVTGFALRQRIGGGNPTRLRAVWNEYAAATEVTQAEPVAELPVEIAGELDSVTQALSERIRNLAVDLNDRAVKAAERRVAEVVRAAGEEREQVKRELAEADEAVEELEGRIRELDANADTAAAQLAEAQSAKQAQALEIAQLRARLAAETRAREAAQARTEKLNETVATLTDKLSVSEQRATKSEARNGDLQEEIIRLRANLETAQTGHREQTAAVAALAAEKKATEERTAQEIERLKAAAAETEQRARNESDRQASEIAELRGRSEEHTSELQSPLNIV